MMEKCTFRVIKDIKDYNGLVVLKVGQIISAPYYFKAGDSFLVPKNCIGPYFEGFMLPNSYVEVIEN